MACGRHALIPIKPGMFIIYARHHRLDFKIEIYKINGGFVLDRIWVFDAGEWDREPPLSLAKAVEVAKAKACDYHCRRPYFIKV